MLEEEAAELTIAYAETVGEFVNAGAGAVECSFGDESEGARDSVGGTAP
jgi:hypothetical protein